MNQQAKTFTWAQPVGSRRWHVRKTEKSFVCGAYSGPRFNGIVQVMRNVAADDFPVLACIRCLAGLTDGKEAMEEK